MMGDNKLKLIIGLGNPEKRFHLTRHNIGFMIVDAFADTLKLKDGWVRTNDGLAPIPIQYGFSLNNECPIVVLKPQNWMNNSGFPIYRVMKALRIKTNQILVVHDDMDFEFGKYKIKQGGGHGRHNGVKSIIKYCGKNFVRLRWGIGRPQGKKSSRNYVLSKFNTREQRTFCSLFNLTSSIIHDYAVKGIQQTMNLYNRSM